jgi:hypothetical protein
MFKLLIILVLMTSLATTTSQYAIAQSSNLGNATSVSTSTSTSTSQGTQPVVSFPSQQEIIQYFIALGEVENFTKIAEVSDGNVRNIEVATDGNNSYIVWQVDIANGSAPIFLSVSNDGGENYFAPLELTHSDVRNSSELQIAAINNSVFVVWQQTNATTGRDSIFISSSMDSNEFRTYQLNTGDSAARSPKLFTEESDVAVVWVQRNFDNSTGCGGGEGGFPDMPINLTVGGGGGNAPELLTNQTASVESTGVDDLDDLPDIICKHRRPW